MLWRTLAQPRERALSGFWLAGRWPLRRRAWPWAYRYPRHSLAAGASLVILGAIWYTRGSRNL